LRVLKKQTVNQCTLFKNKTLLYEVPSAVEIIKETNINPSTVSNCLKDISIKVFKTLNISHIGPIPNIRLKK
jgi:hypothetical protein